MASIDSESQADHANIFEKILDDPSPTLVYTFQKLTDPGCNFSKVHRSWMTLSKCLTTTFDTLGTLVIKTGLGRVGIIFEYRPDLWPKTAH